MNNLFEGVQCFQIFLRFFAELGDWGTVNSLVRTCRRANHWVNTADGQKFDGWHGSQKELRDLLGSRDIELSKNRIAYKQRGRLHRVHGPALIEMLIQPEDGLNMEWHLDGEIQRSVFIPRDATKARLDRLVPSYVPESLQAKFKKSHTYWSVKSTYRLYWKERYLAQHHRDTALYVTYDASNAAIFNPSLSLPLDLSSYASDDEASEEAADDPIGLQFFANAYDQIEAVEKMAREKKRARLNAPVQPKKRRLVRRSDSDEED